MANLPQLRSPEQILGDLLDGFRSRVRSVPVDQNAGAVIVQFLESVKQSNFKSYAAVIAMIDALSVDRAVGDALQRLARDRKVPIFPSIPSSGNVSITDTTFQKIETTVFAGQPAPVAGSLVLYVSDASNWPTNGVIYIGRGTANFEGPLQYTGVTPLGSGSYWQVTLDASSPTTRFHNLSEPVVVGQGGIRTVQAGTIVQTATGTSVTAVQFTTTSSASIPDGEVTVTDVPVIATVPGPLGNVPAGAIKQAIGLAFNASVANAQPYSNGRDADNDDQIRARIKAFEQIKSKGTEQAIRLSALNVVAQDELKRVVSSNVVRYTDDSAALIFDDGTGYEYKFVGVGIEQVEDEALGGIPDLQLRQKPIAQARVEGNEPGPFNIPDAYALSVTVAGVTTVHFFKSSDFRVPAAATAIEVASSINGDYNINFSADTSRGGTRVVVYPRDPKASDIKVNRLASVDASLIVGFPDIQEFTLRLYKNDMPLFENGLFATVSSRAKPTWSNAIGDGDTLIYRVDGTPPITAVLSLAAFQAVDVTAAVSSSTPIGIWAEVLTSIMPGISVAVNGEILEFTSNKDTDNRARVEIVGGTVRDKMFEVDSELLSVGRGSDYTLNRQTAQLALSAPLFPGDRVSAGSAFTKGNALTASIPAGPSTEGRVWFVVDGSAEAIPTELQSTSQIRFSRTMGSPLVTIDARNGDSFAAEGFGLIRQGDWLLIWANPADSSNIKDNQLMLRVESAQVGQIVVSGDEASVSNVGAWFNVSIDRLVVVRSAAPMQRFEYDITDLNTFTALIPQQVLGVDAEIVGSRVRIATKTADLNGELMVAAVDGGGRALDLPVSIPIRNIPSQRGFVVTNDSEAGFPNFNYSEFTDVVDADTAVDPEYENLGGRRDDFIELLDRYNVAQYRALPDSNKGRRALAQNFDVSPDEIELLIPKYMESGVSTVDPDFDAMHPTIQPGDRYFIRSSYQFDSQDSLSVVIDGDPRTKSYSMPVARRLEVSSHSTPALQDFSASDLESSLDLDDPGSFENFDFANFKAWRQARITLTDGTYELGMRSRDFGPAGNRLRIGFIYPDSTEVDALQIRVAASDVVDFGIMLPVTDTRTPNWDASSSFTVSVVTTDGKDAVTYTHRIGTEPDFLAAGVIAGDVAILDFLLQFLPDNDGYSAKVASVNATDFTLELPTGRVQNDAIQWDSIDNTNGVITLTKSTGHGLNVGQQFGLYDTAILTGATRPFDSGTYIANTASATQITANVPAGVPGGPVSSGTHVANVATINSTAHGLFVGNVIKISGAGAPYDGLYSVSAVPNADQFQYVLTGSSGPTASGRFDFQSISATITVAAITDMVRAASTNVVTATTAAPHGFTVGQLVSVQSVLVDDWVTATNYNFGDVVRDPLDSNNYKAVAAGVSNTNPSLDPVQWALTAFDLSGIFAVSAVPTASSFEYLYSDDTGETNASTASATLYGAQAKLARSIGGAASRLSFVEVSTTAQEVVDFLAVEAAEQVFATVTNGNGAAPITMSTEDQEAAADYLDGSVVSISSIKGSRTVKITVDSQVEAGATITVNSGAAAYDGTYVVLESVQSGPNWILTVVSAVFALSTGTVSGGAGTFVGSTKYLMCHDGENQILTQDLGSSAGVPQFELKRSWIDAPEVGEEIRLVATTSDHLTRFWNRLVVTGMSNVATIDNSEYGRQLQLATQTFGSIGSIQVSGGIANSRNVALLGSGSSLDNKLGSFTIPYELRRGINAGNWIRVQNTVRNNKDVGFSETTFLQAFTNGLQIDTSENFVVQRATTATNTTAFKIERHGNFVAFIRIDGGALNLGTAGVREGDWVRIRNVPGQLWSASVSYAIGNKVRDNAGNRYVATAASLNQPVSNNAFWQQFDEWDDVVTYAPAAFVNYNGRMWFAAAGSTGVLPGSNAAIWEPREFDAANNGIFRVVRVFGEDAFWIENANIVEEISRIGDARDLSFYTYDSVMPGDTLVIAGNILNPINAGRYTVLDEASDGSSFFPTSKRIYTDPLQQSTATTLLGLSYSQVTIEEQNPVEMIKRVFAVGPGGGVYGLVIVDSPELMDRVSSANGAFVTVGGKMDYATGVSYGLDGYKYFTGLPAQLNRVIYGDPANATVYPGVRAAGTPVDIKKATLKRIQLALAIRTRIGIPFSQVVERVKAAVAGYVNQLGTGEQVSLSEVVTAASQVNGVISVAITFPAYGPGNDLIAVAAAEKAFISNPSSDVIVSVLGV